MTNYLMFDQTLPLLVSVLEQEAGSDFTQSGTIVRDASGRLAFLAARPANGEKERAVLTEAVRSRLGPYAREEGCVRFVGDPGTAAVSSDQSVLPIRIGENFYRLLDRRIVGSGWLSSPAAEPSDPPTFVFATLKGGVGRSTALTVAAADLARRGRNVLVVDLDLEAPGLGDLLLDESRTPAFGVIDYLVENGIAQIPRSRLSEFIGTSGLTSAGGGRVDVMPAIGLASSEYPENVLAKLSRAMTEDVGSFGVVPVGLQISDMIRAVTEHEQYDVVFIDSRAGLSELAAPAVLGLGATVFLFGTAQRQTIEGYRTLFAALQLLAQRDKGLGKAAEWRTSLRPVYAKSSMDEDIGERYVDEIYELYSAHIYDEEEEGQDFGGDALRFLRDDPEGPHRPLVIPFNANFIDFDPSRNPGQLTATFYEQTFRTFLDGIDKAMTSNETDGPAR